MKKALAIALCLINLLLLCSCTAKEQSNMETTTETGNAAVKTVTFVNGVKEADVWILPQTQENLKTTLWGTPTISDVKTGESIEFPLCEPGDNGLYILRMIDTDSFYYSANGIELREGCILKIKGNELQSITVEVADENDELISSYEAFAARL